MTFNRETIKKIMTKMNISLDDLEVENYDFTQRLIMRLNHVDGQHVGRFDEDEVYLHHVIRNMIHLIKFETESKKVQDRIEEDEKLKYSIGERIRQLRSDKNITQSEFGKKIGCTSNTIANWESGRRRPAVPKLMLIAETLQTTVEYLLKGEGQTPEINENDELKLIQRISHNGRMSSEQMSIELPNEISIFWEAEEYEIHSLNQSELILKRKDDKK